MQHTSCKLDDEHLDIRSTGQTYSAKTGSSSGGDGDGRRLGPGVIGVFVSPSTVKFAPKPSLRRPFGLEGPAAGVLSSGGSRSLPPPLPPPRSRLLRLPPIPTSSTSKSACTRRTSLLSREVISAPCSSTMCAFRSRADAKTTNLRAWH